MKKKIVICGISALVIGMVSCKSSKSDVKQYDTESVNIMNNTEESVTDKDLVEKYWKLTELFGEPVVTPEGGKDAHLIFKIENNRVTGSGGCNTLNGSYTLMPGNRISFSQMISTMMMCANMDVEMKLSQVLGMTDNYLVSGDKLVLNKARMAPLARFEAVYLN